MRTLACMCWLMLVRPLLGAEASTELFVPVAGQVRTASALLYRTSLSITNVSERPAVVQVTFLERHPVKAPGTPLTLRVNAGETIGIADLPLRLGKSHVLGAFRLVSTVPVFAIARIDAVRDGESGAPTTGATVAAVPPEAGLAKGEEASIHGIHEDAAAGLHFKTYFIETGGRPAGVLARVVAASGSEYGHRSFLLEPYEQRVLSVSEIVPGAVINNGRLVFRVLSGAGRAYAIGQATSPSGAGLFFTMVSTKRRADERAWTLELMIYICTALTIIASVVHQYFRAPK